MIVYINIISLLGFELKIAKYQTISNLHGNEWILLLRNIHHAVSWQVLSILKSFHNHFSDHPLQNTFTRSYKLSDIPCTGT